MSLEVTDRFGNPIEPGTYVTWPIRSGSSLSVLDGMVDHIEFRQSSIYGAGVVPFIYIKKLGDGAIHYTEMLDRVTVIARQES